MLSLVLFNSELGYNETDFGTITDTASGTGATSTHSISSDSISFVGRTSNPTANSGRVDGYSQHLLSEYVDLTAYQKMNLIGNITYSGRNAGSTDHGVFYIDLVPEVGNAVTIYQSPEKPNGAVSLQLDLTEYSGNYKIRFRTYQTGFWYNNQKEDGVMTGQFSNIYFS